MYTEIYDFFDLKEPISNYKYYETDGHRELYQDIKLLVKSGGIFALTGLVGSGKTVILNKLEEALKIEQEVIVVRSLSANKNKLTINTVCLALFFDLTHGQKNYKLPTTGETRERELVSLMKKHNKPVVLFIDEAHDISSQMLTSFKRIFEVATYGGCKLSIVLIGQPKLRNMLRKPSMEEIGARVKHFNTDQALGSLHQYTQWRIKQSLKKGASLNDVITKEAVEKISSTLITPLQVSSLLEEVIKLAYQYGEKPISEKLIDEVLNQTIDRESVESILARNGYPMKDACELLSASPKEIKSFYLGRDFTRKQEFIDIVESIGINAQSYCNE